MLFRSYKISVTQIDESDGGGLLLEIPELGKLSTCAWGETYEEAYAVLREIQRENIEDLIAKGLDVPEPITDENYSGRLNLRMSKSLHRRLAEVAAQEEVSLNTLIINSLHETLGCRGVEKLIEQGIEQVEKVFNQLNQLEMFHYHAISPANTDQKAEAQKRMAKIRESRNDDNEFLKVS